MAEEAEKVALTLSLKEAHERTNQLQQDFDAKTMSHEQLTTEKEARDNQVLELEAYVESLKQEALAKTAEQEEKAKFEQEGA